ncbi:hypothetical protein [Nocardia goodfellowii]|uniref:Uncharacterized protein n=1 Tax=Nocardia goodfellowii TaxID=882446 RepID=A0ABS4QJT0_9NOCA|nr:hypothetical protein [Nocardia goodfellowii]MBP2191375.1 hypothetical protein [Nocardia goodfellowii]
MPLIVREGTTDVDFTFEELMKYHGPYFPGGVAHGFTAMRVALPLLAPVVQRREVLVRTAFRGPGGRDAVEMVLRAGTDGRYTVTPELEKPERGLVLERYVWEFGYRDATVTVQLADNGFVVEEFIAQWKALRIARRPAAPAKKAGVIRRRKSSRRTSIISVKRLRRSSFPTASWVATAKRSDTSARARRRTSQPIMDAQTIQLPEFALRPSCRCFRARRHEGAPRGFAGLLPWEPGSVRVSWCSIRFLSSTPDPGGFPRSDSTSRGGRLLSSSLVLEVWKHSDGEGDRR